MSSTTVKNVISDTAGRPSRGLFILVLAPIVGSLVVYKSMSSMKALRFALDSHTLIARPEIVALGQTSDIGVLQRSVNYFSAIWPALIFGLLIGAAFRAFVSPQWFTHLLKRRSLTQVTAGLAGAPLMLCSCCVAPIFTSVAETSERIGPALGMALASPGLNPAALALTFVLFEPRIAFGRAVLAVLAVAFIGPAVERIFPDHRVRGIEPQQLSGTARGPMLLRFLKALATVSIRTIPGLIAGIVISMLIVHWLPARAFASPDFRAAAILLAATVAIPLALPTFLEIPLAFGLLAGGFPPGAAVALLFAGPAVNLPSLFSIARVSGWRVAVVVAILVWILAVCGGLLIG